MKDKKDYYLGLDIGTSSVGWAVTDENYNILRFNKKRMLGVRLFDEAATAEERRTKRTARRRLERRRNRLALLEEIFAEEVAKVDNTFFLRLKESKFHLEDKYVDTSNVLFNDKDYKDKKFFKNYPTIYHLRDALVREDKKFDIREIFLAIHHIIKYRGHFLIKGEITDTNDNIEQMIKDVASSLDLELSDAKKINITDDIALKIKDTLLEKNMTLNDKKKYFKEISSKNSAFETIFALVAGSKTKIKNIFVDEEFEDKEGDKEITFKNDYFEARAEYEELLGEKIEVLDKAKMLYDAIILSFIKPTGKTISQAKIDTYNKHKEDLKKLKTITKSNKAVFDAIFKEKEEKGKRKDKEKKITTGYYNYIKKSKYGKACSQADFYKFLYSVDNKGVEKGQLSEIIDSQIKKEIIRDIALNNFLPLQRIKDNGVIPYQIHKSELISILENASKYYEFLNEKKEGLTVKEMIIKLLEFRVPYYVGPLNNHKTTENGGFAWIVRRKGIKITPWNFEKVVDVEASAEKFITNMTNKCSYLIGKDVIPKESLLYSEFSLLNELNNLRYMGNKLPVNIKLKMVEDLFKTGNRKIGKKTILDFLKSEGYCDGKGELTGLDKEIKTKLKSFVDMERIFGKGYDKEMAENIIKWVTLFGDASKILESKIESVYGEKISKEQLKAIKALKYKDWGRLSKEFLTEIQSDTLSNEETGEMLNIINAMRYGQENLMELLSNAFDFQEKIQTLNKENSKPVEEFGYEILDDLYVSPAVKRSIWQTLKIVEEIKYIMGKKPLKIFIEMTRREGEKKSTTSRKNKLLALYKNIKEDKDFWNNDIKSKDENLFKIKKIYLYYLQRGKCMYSGDTIDFEKLLSGEDYDIDHIFPRSRTKDDSFDNLVLVKSKLNRDKTDSYPLEVATQENMKNFWYFLKEKQLISDKKYDRLTRKTGFTDAEIDGFIARQLVEASQSTKVVAEILDRLNNPGDKKETRIVYVKAENVTTFRQISSPVYKARQKLKDKTKDERDELTKDIEDPFMKLRDVNDFHHAKDAYLNIVVGNVYDEKFTKRTINFIKQINSEENARIKERRNPTQEEIEKRRRYSLTQLFNYDLERAGKYIWDRTKSIKIVEKTMKLTDIRITKKTVEQKGSLYDETIYKSIDVNEKGYFPIKVKESRLLDMKKYGGYTSIKNAHYKVIKYKSQNKKGSIENIVRIIPIPIYLIKNGYNENMIKEYIIKAINDNKGIISDLEIICDKLCINSVVEMNGFRYFVGGRTGDQICMDGSIPLILDYQSEKYIKKIASIIAKYPKKDEIPNDKFDREANQRLYDVLIGKKEFSVFKHKKLNKLSEFKSEEVINAFKGLSECEQALVLLEVLNTLTDKKTTFDDKIWAKIKMKYSRIKLGMNITNLDSFIVHNQSVTGLFENSIDLMKI